MDEIKMESILWNGLTNGWIASAGLLVVCPGKHAGGFGGFDDDSV
jgi:hypothetical protein